MRESVVALFFALVGLASTISFVLREPTRGNIGRLFRGKDRRNIR